MRNFACIFFAVLIGLGVGGCKPTATPRSAWVTEWLDRPICQSPCWGNIVPGDTPLADVPKILATIPGVTEILGPEEWGIHRRCFEWSMDGCENATFGLACADENSNEIVSTIDLNFYSCKEGAELTLKDFLDAFGAPTHEVPFANQIGGCETQIFYLDDGMTLSASGAYTWLDNTMEITPDWSVGKVEFFQPQNDLHSAVKVLNWGTHINEKRAIEWNGYTDYPSCQ